MKQLNRHGKRRAGGLILAGATVVAVLTAPMLAGASPLDGGGFKIRAVNTENGAVSAVRGMNGLESQSDGGGDSTPGSGSEGSTTDPTAIPKGNLPNWTMNYSEDFTKDADNISDLWDTYGESMVGYRDKNDTSGHGLYSPDKVLTVQDGKLTWYLHTENGQPLVATPVLNDYHGQTYGRYSIRFRADRVPGYKIAFMQWPISNQWNEGEINWPEGNLEDGRIRPALAIPGTYNSATGRMDTAPGEEMFADSTVYDWHVATTEWSPAGVKWFLDGKLVASTTEHPTTDFRWTLQVETEIGDTIPAPEARGKVEVDWAVSYSYDG